MEDNKKIYCGCYSIPQGARRGTQKECLAKRQIRYYGKKHVDKELLKDRQKKKEKSQDEIKQLELAAKLGALSGKITNLSWKYKQNPNPDKKALFKEEGLKLMAEAEIIQKQFDEVTKRIKQAKENKQ